MWPLYLWSSDEGENFFFFPMPLESACWEHICKPLNWNVVPSEPASYKEFIGLKQIEPECSLPRFYFLRSKCFGYQEVNFYFYFYFLSLQQM